MTMMGKKLIIGQINARHSPPVMEILGRVAIERKMDILLIQEPPLALVRREWSFPGYRIYVASGHNPLTAIMVHVPFRLVRWIWRALGCVELWCLQNWVIFGFSQPTFVISRALAWTNSRMGWNSLLPPRACDLWASH